MAPSVKLHNNLLRGLKEIFVSDACELLTNNRIVFLPLIRSLTIMASIGLLTGNTVCVLFTGNYKVVFLFESGTCEL